MSPQEEAGQLFHQVVKGLMNREMDLKVALRTCQHACQLLGWPQAEWFRMELSGYMDDRELGPDDRLLVGREMVVDLPINPDNVYYVVRTRPFELPITTMQTLEGIDALRSKAAAQRPEIKPIDEPKTEFSYNQARPIKKQKLAVFPQTSYTRVLQETEQAVFDFASKSYTTLRYGNAITEIWTHYRGEVDAAIREMGLVDTLDAIHAGLQTDNAEEWRQVVYGCRNLLTDLADRLWQDPRPTYDYLESPSNKSGKLEVDYGKFANRLRAYLHQKGWKKSREKNYDFETDELYYLAKIFNRLSAYQSLAHAPVTREDARSVALATYLAIGELVVKTDMQPILQYGPIKAES